MDSEIYKKTHKRIRELFAFPHEDGDPLHFMFGEERSCWNVPVDSTNTGSVTGINDSRRIPMDRMLVLGQNRLVPSANLPSFISYIGGCETVSSLPVTGDADKVYKVTVGDITTFYRWVDDEEGGTSGFYPIRSNYVLSDGAGTLVSDVDAGYTREIDINIGNPSAHDSKILAISDGKLVHTKSGVGDSPVTMPTASTVTTFGDTFNVPAFTVDSTGHVNSLSETTITIPSTAASTSAHGLVKIGSLSDIRPIASSNTVGNASDGGYLLIAPADHAHSATKITFSNLPTGTVEYDMSANQTLDMKYTIMALPPSNAQNSLAAGMFLTSTTASGNDRNTLWKSPQQYFQQDVNTYENGTSYIITSTGNGKELMSRPVKENSIYLVSAEVELSLDIALAPSTTASNLPIVYECNLKFNDALSTTRNILVPGDYSYTVPYRESISCVVKTSSGQSLLVISARMDDEVFHGRCIYLTAQELM